MNLNLYTQYSDRRLYRSLQPQTNSLNRVYSQYEDAFLFVKVAHYNTPHSQPRPKNHYTFTYQALKGI